LFRDEAEAIHHKFAIGFGNDQLDFSIRAQKGDKGLFVQVVRVIVARGNDVDEIQTFGSNDALGHAHMGLVGRGVFLRK
jgi:hypothetical protein